MGVLNGFFWALVIAATTAIWFGDPTLGFIIACAMLINLVTAGFTGAGLPIVLQKLEIDPALAGSMTVTTITDVMGFLTFLGLATLLQLSGESMTKNQDINNNLDLEVSKASASGR